MNHHRIKPRPGHIRRERDYVLYEKSHFFHGIAHALRAWQLYLGPDIVTTALLEALEREDMAAITQHREAARKKTWESMHTGNENKAAGMLMLLDALESPIIAEAKEADSLTTERRKT